MTREERIEAALATVGKTTPGPWETFDRGDYSDCCGDSRVIIGNDMRVAIVEDDGSAETMANTDLISAASLLRDEVIALRAQVGDMAMIVRKLVHRLGPENTTSKQALDYLFRKGLQGSPARDTALTQIESEKVVEG